MLVLSTSLTRFNWLCARVSPSVVHVGWWINKGWGACGPTKNELLVSAWVEEMLAESCCAAVAVIHFHRRSVVFAVSPMLGFCKKNSGFSQEMGVYSVFVGLLTQLCSSSLNVCVERGHVCIHKAHFPSLPSSAHSIFTALWCGSVIKLNTFYLHQAPSWICLV